MTGEMGRMVRGRREQWRCKQVEGRHVRDIEEEDKRRENMETEKRKVEER